MTTKSINVPAPSEDREQEMLFQWAEMQQGAWPELALLHAIPNGGYRYKATAARMARTGVKRGVPDICLPVARGGFHGLYIEMKRRQKSLSHVSDDQQLWLAALRRQGFCAVVCYGFDEARELLSKYLRGVM